MRIHLNPEQEQVLAEAVSSGPARTPDEALSRALELLHENVLIRTSPDAASAARRLALFGKRHGFSRAGLTGKDLLHESRP